MTYSLKSKTFNMTSTKLRKWHHSNHKQSDPNCIFCRGNMEEIAIFLSEIHSLDIIDVGHAWVKIRAEKNYRSEHGGMTDESRLLYQLVSGKPNDNEFVIGKDVNKTLLELPAAIVQKNICPKCGARMIIRKGTFGEFLGCTQFPQCKFTRRI
jgi:predicted RNA-binding Zn-ribbon protein involved in translation (DUF1610 family)